MLHEVTEESLFSLPGREYITEVRNRMNDNALWAEITSTPRLLNRTRWALTRFIGSLDNQIERAKGDVATDEYWLNAVTGMRKRAKSRLDAIPERKIVVTNDAAVATSREARAWRGFAAQLASIAVEVDPSALSGLRTPYGDLDVVDWLAAREAKQMNRKGE